MDGESDRGGNPQAKSSGVSRQGPAYPSQRSDREAPEGRGKRLWVAWTKRGKEGNSGSKIHVLHGWEVHFTDFTRTLGVEDVEALRLGLSHSPFSTRSKHLHEPRRSDIVEGRRIGRKYQPVREQSI